MNDERPAEPELFFCTKLSCVLSQYACVARQVRSEQRLGRRRNDPSRPHELARHYGKRGIAPRFPTCLPGRCLQGAAIREELVPSIGLPKSRPLDDWPLPAERRAR